MKIKKEIYLTGLINSNQKDISPLFVMFQPKKIIYLIVC